MVTVNRHPKPLTESSLRAYFHDSLSRAMQNQRVEAEDATVWYLTNLLTQFSRSENLFEHTTAGPTLRPLALLYAAAIEARSTAQRRLVLQRLGDVALFLSGVLAGRLSRRLRDVDYCIAMGGRAYGCLSEADEHGARGRAQGDVFRELSTQFPEFVDVVAEAGERAPGADHRDVLQLYEEWCKTGSRRLERRLRSLGVTPLRYTQPQ